MKKTHVHPVDNAVKVTKKQFISMPRFGGCGEGWTCDRCPNLGCPANERN